MRSDHFQQVDMAAVFEAAQALLKGIWVHEGLVQLVPPQRLRAATWQSVADQCRWEEPSAHRQSLSSSGTRLKPVRRLQCVTAANQCVSLLLTCRKSKRVPPKSQAGRIADIGHLCGKTGGGSRFGKSC